MENLRDANSIGHNNAFYRHYCSPEVRALFSTVKWFDGRIKQAKPRKKNTQRETVYRHILATPLVEVLSISIGSHLDNGERPTMCEIYGQIRVMDTRLGGGEILTLFHKDEDNPQSIKLDEPLLLTPSSRTAVIVPSKYTMLDVLLYNRKANNKVVVNGRLVLDKTDDRCEEDHVREVNGKDDVIFARVHYTIFQHAVAATVDVLFFREADNSELPTDDTVYSIYDDDDDDGGEYAEEKSDEMDLSDYDSRDSGDSRDSYVTDVFGSVTVRSNVNNGNDKGYPSISLFNKSHEKGVQVKSGGFVQLSKSVVAVPAYSSSLVIEVNLSDRNTMKPIASGILEFKPRHEDAFKKDLGGEHGRVRVRVTWNHAYDQQLYRAGEKKQECQEPEEVEEDDWDPSQKLEVFSVVVHSKDFKPFSFYGVIYVKDWAKFCIFSKDKSCPQVCLEGGAVATVKGTNPRLVTAVDYFSIHVDLKDATTGAQISNGCASWDARLIWPWLDRRICSVVRGERGFAVVHYTAFFDGISATVDVKLCGENIPGYVYGKIVAHYGTYEYSTSYDKKYYQIILFDRHTEDDGSQQGQPCDSSVPLLKPVVCMPRNSSLIIEVDLSVSSEPSFDGKFPQGATLLQGTLELKPGGDGESVERLCGGSCGIDVHLKRRLF